MWWCAICYAMLSRSERMTLAVFCAKEIISDYLRTYLNGCRRNDCCSYDWDNYIVPASWAAVTARYERWQDERERECRPSTVGRIDQSKRSCRIDNVLTTILLPLFRRVQTVCTQYIQRSAMVRSFPLQIKKDLAMCYCRTKLAN